MKITLVQDWRNCWRFWSIRLTLLGSALLSAFFAFPDAMLQVWAMLPQDVKEYMPAEWAKWIPVFLILAGSLARVVKQKALENDH